MAGFTALVVDRGGPGGGALFAQCARDPRVAVVGVARDGSSAIELTRALRPDAAFLDVDVADGGGMALAEAIGAAGPAVVLTTGRGDLAAEAFDLAAVDFLLKPLTSCRLSIAIARLAEALERRRARAAEEDDLWLPRSAGMVRVDVRRIQRVEAERDYVRLVAGAESFLLRATMGDIERRLPAARFVRIHRSTIVAIAQVRACRHVGNGAWEILSPEGDAQPVGRRYLPAVRERLGLATAATADGAGRGSGAQRGWRPASSAARLSSAAPPT